jgi:hypothetical protein
MKRTLTYTFVLALLIAAAGIAWAAQPAVDVAPVDSPDSAVTETPTPDVDPILGDLVIEPNEVYDCCKIECYDNWGDCNAGCGSQACFANCKAVRDACIANC